MTCAICADAPAATVTQIDGRTFRVCAPCATAEVAPRRDDAARACLAETDDGYCAAPAMRGRRFCASHGHDRRRRGGVQACTA